jgi:hypothetical protein
MAKHILPDNLRSRIRQLSDKGYNTIEIFDSVIDEATEYVDSHEQLTRCISAITKKSSSGRHEGISAQQNERQIPEIKP